MRNREARETKECERNWSERQSGGKKKWTEREKTVRKTEERDRRRSERERGARERQK